MDSATADRLARKRLLRVVCYLLVGLIGVDVIVDHYRGLWQTYSPDDYRERLHGCRQHRQDIIAVGGSPVSEGIDPAFLVGLNWQGHVCEKTFALGLPGGTTSEFWHAIKHGAPQPPHVLIYGITASDLNDRRHEPHGMYSLMDWSDLGAWVTTRPRSAEYVTRHFVQAKLSRTWQLFRYRDGIRMWLAERAEQVCPGSFTDSARQARINREYTMALRAGNGFAPNEGFRYRRYDEFKAAGHEEGPFHFLHDYRISGGRIGCLHKLIDWASAHGTKLVLVDMPVACDLERKYGPAFDIYRKALAEIESQRNVTVLRATRETAGITDRQFADMIHLNKDGADALSAWIRAQLDGMKG